MRVARAPQFDRQRRVSVFLAATSELELCLLVLDLRRSRPRPTISYDHVNGVLNAVLDSG
ncbi:MAG: hypothetical protein JWO48_3606, partial [Bryobacterales bacterium]|nr:hypothetical protein [Bryobacterales bacterium]